MAELFQYERVKYLCSCGLLKPLCYLYFCRHCLKVRCTNCVSIEVYAMFCSGCLEMMNATESAYKKNRCSSCKICPCCSHLLSTRSTSIQAPSQDDPTKLAPKKVYYVACAFCRWSSRDSNLPDQNVASGCWMYYENEHLARISSLADNMRALAAVEKRQQDNRRYGRGSDTRRYLEEKGKLGSFSRYGVSGRTGLSCSSRTGSSGKVVDASILEQLRSEPVEDVAQLYDDGDDEEDDEEQELSQCVDLMSVSTLQERLSSWQQQQPLQCCKLQPSYKHVEMKRSLRCRRCDHNLCKPSHSAINTKFRIQLNAYYHLPDVRIQLVPDKLAAGQCYSVWLTFTNPTSNAMSVWLEKYYDPDDDERLESPDPEHRDVSLLRVVTLQPVQPDIQCTAELQLPSAQFVMAPRDDVSAEFDDTTHTQTQQTLDHTGDSAVVWRRSNKVCVRAVLTIPAAQHDDNTARGGFSVVAALVLNYRYTNAVISSESSSPQLIDLRARVLIDFGTVLTSSQSQ